MSSYGGAGNGVIYSFDPSNSNTYTQLSTLPNAAQYISGSFVQGNIDHDQQMYTVTSSDSSYGAGALISITTAGAVAVLHAFIGERIS